jgi:hypothetical protein
MNPRWPLIVGTVLLIALGLGLRWEYSADWLVDGRVTLVDADCYTRLFRVQEILNGHGLFQRFHHFENYPAGIKPHTTFPLDALILLLYFPLKWISAHPLDWAGALVSPLLYALTGLLIAVQRSISVTSRAFLLLGLALLPPLVWATPFARPDHQALLVALICVAWIAEWRRWQTPGRFWHIVFIVTMALALWTSAFEPLALLIVLLIVNLIFRSRAQEKMAGSEIERWSPLLFLIPAGAAYSAGSFFSSDDPYLWNWLATIGEIKPLAFGQLVILLSPLLLLTPVLFFRTWRLRGLQPELILFTFLTVTLAGLSLWQRRWFYFAGLAEIFLVAWWLQHEISRPLKTAGIALFVLGLAWPTYRQIRDTAMAEPRITPQVRQMAASIQAPGAILAPWWIAPSLLYYSGQPIVGSSSHQSIAGTADTAHFFATENWPLADAILKKHHVRWVVVYEADRLLENSRQILGLPPQPPNGRTVTERLWITHAVPSRFILRGASSSLRVYEYRDFVEGPLSYAP